MAKIITENFKIETTNELFNSLDDQSYYVVASGSKTKSEFQVGAKIQNTQTSKRDFLRKIIFGKKLSTNNARYMFIENPWVKGTIYDQYDDTKDIESLNMVVSVREQGSGNYLIFKCLDNNNNSPSQEITGTVDQNNYQMSITQDGYRWQFMFKVLASEVRDFKSSGDLPLPVISGVDNAYGDPLVRASAKEDISNIIIEDTVPNQFNQYLFGEATSANNTSDVIIIDGDSTTVGDFKNIVVTATTKTNRTLYSSADAYKNMYLRHGATGKLYDVEATTSDANTNQIRLRVRTRDIFSTQQVCQLLIKVNISSSTLTGTRAKAYLILDEFGTAKSVGFETRGSNYKFAQAEVVYPPLLKPSASVQSNPTILRAIVSPRGGHGKDPISEIAMSKLSMAIGFVGGSATTPSFNEYSIIGLLKNPTFTDSSGASVTPTAFDNRTVLTVPNSSTPESDHIDPSGDSANESLDTIHTLLRGGGGVNSYVEQYIKTISVQNMVDGVSYTICSLGTGVAGTMGTNDFTAIGATGESPSVGDVFTSTNTASIGSEKNATVSFVVDRVDVTNTDYDYGLDIVKGKIHEISSDTTNTYISLVDYYGDFQHKFQKGVFYIKETPTAPVSINSKITNSISYGQYDAYSGDLLHFIDFSPITRESSKNENIKFTFDF